MRARRSYHIINAMAFPSFADNSDIGMNKHRDDLGNLDELSSLLEVEMADETAQVENENYVLAVFGLFQGDGKEPTGNTADTPNHNHTQPLLTEQTKDAQQSSSANNNGMQSNQQQLIRSGRFQQNSADETAEVSSAVFDLLQEIEHGRTRNDDDVILERSELSLDENCLFILPLTKDKLMLAAPPSISKKSAVTKYQESWNKRFHELEVCLVLHIVLCFIGSIFDHLRLIYYFLIQAFKSQYGHCNVPQTHKHNPSLGRWLAQQRISMRKWKDIKPELGGGKYKTNNWRMSMLKQLGLDASIGKYSLI